MGDVAARINFIRNRKKELAKSRKEGAPDGNALPSKEKHRNISHGEPLLFR
jgi:hypothetical protein